MEMFFDGGVMSLRPTQGDETPSPQQPLSMEAFALPFVIPRVCDFIGFT